MTDKRHGPLFLLIAGLAFMPALASAQTQEQMRAIMLKDVPKEIQALPFLQQIAVAVRINTFDGFCAQFYGPLSQNYKKFVIAIVGLGGREGQEIWQAMQGNLTNEVFASRKGNDYATATKAWCAENAKFALKIGEQLAYMQDDQAKKAQQAPPSPVETDYDRCLKQATTGYEITQCHDDLSKAKQGTAQQSQPANKSGQKAGAPGATTLSQVELNAMRARLARLWNVTPNVEHPEELFVTIRIRLNPDRQLAAPPQVVSSGSSPSYQAAADAAVQAVINGQPYTMLQYESYEQWKYLEIDFDPTLIFRNRQADQP